MELDAPDVVFAVAECHNLSFPAFGYHLEDGRERGLVYYPRVVPAYRNLVRKPSEEVILGIDGYRALDAVEDGGEVDELSSEHFADGLLAQADA